MLNIATHIYSGWGTSTAGILPMADVVPVGNSANEKRKIDSFTRKYTIIKEHENIPLPGFTLEKTRRSVMSEDSWIVIDPRGFKVTISSYNLENILHVTGITEGLIQQRCVWAREDSQTRLTLLPVSAKNFEEAVANTTMIEEKVNIKDVKIGDTVMLQNKLVGKFLGSLSVYGSIQYDYRNTNIYRAGVMLRRQVVEISPGNYFIQSDAKILKVVTSATEIITKETVAKELNERIEQNDALFLSHTSIPNNRAHYIHSFNYDSRFVSAHATPKVTLKAREVPLAEFTNMLNIMAANKDNSLIVQKGANYYLIEMPLYGSGKIMPNRFTVFQIARTFNIGDNTIAFDINNLGSSIITDKPDRRLSSYNVREAPKEYSVDNFTNFYIIEKHVKDGKYI